MASAFGHIAAAAALGAVLYRPGWPARVWALGAASAVLPDADVIGLAFGIPFGSPLGHRGLSHSIPFAAAVAGIAVALGSRGTAGGAPRAGLWLYLFLAITSHGVLDALTDGGPGIAFFAPFDNARYFFPFRPLVVSPLGILPFFSAWGLRVIESELVWIGTPCLLVAALALVVRRCRRPATKTG